MFHVKHRKLRLFADTEFGEEVVTVLAEEVDRLEDRIREAVPGAQHLDIEAD